MAEPPCLITATARLSRPPVYGRDPNSKPPEHPCPRSPMSATIASPELMDFINWTLLPQLGPYPHGAINGRSEIVIPPMGRSSGRRMIGLSPGSVPLLRRKPCSPQPTSPRSLRLTPQPPPLM